MKRVLLLSLLLALGATACRAPETHTARCRACWRRVETSVKEPGYRPTCPKCWVNGK